MSEDLSNEKNKEKKKIDTIVCGKYLTLVFTEEKDYVLDIVNYINDKAKEFKNKKNPSDTALFLAINITDELFKERNKNKKLENNILKLKSELENLNEKNKQDKKINKTNDKKNKK